MTLTATAPPPPDRPQAMHHWSCSTPTGCWTTTNATSPQPSASSSTPDLSPTSRGGSNRPPCQRNWQRSSVTSACSACTWTATAARAPTPSATGWPAWNWRPATAGSAASFRYRARCRCSRSTGTARRSRRANGCRRLAAGDAIGCFGLTEPDFGSNPAGMRTRAPPRRHRLGAQRHQDVDHQRQPRRCRHRMGADRRRDPRIPGAHRYTGLHRQRDSPQAVAARLGDLRTGLGQRAAARVGAAAARRRSVRLRCRASTRPGSASCSARWAPPATAWKPRSPTPSRGTCSTGRCRSFQLTQEKLANMTVELGKGMLLAIHLGRIKDAEGVRPEQVSLGKLNNVREALASPANAEPCWAPAASPWSIRRCATPTTWSRC